MLRAAEHWFSASPQRSAPTVLCARLPNHSTHILPDPVDTACQGASEGTVVLPWRQLGTWWVGGLVGRVVGPSKLPELAGGMPWPRHMLLCVKLGEAGTQLCMAAELLTQ